MRNISQIMRTSFQRSLVGVVNQSKESGSHFGHDCFTVINGESDRYNGNLKSSGAIISRYWEKK
jgi:hypothetical protein